MKCTDRSRQYYRAKRRRNRWVICLSVILIILCTACAGVYHLKENQKPESLVQEYETQNYNKVLYQGELFAKDLCVTASDVPLNATPDPSGFHAAALFGVNDAATDYAYHIHERVYPASTTKILTALVAIKNGNLSDVVTVSANADSGTFAADEQTCGIKAGDKLTLEDLLYGLLLHSGNDNAVAIAEHIAGSTEAFADMMNAQAADLMATNSHFVNPSGLHNENHYTTAYDLYLIFNECIKHKEFVDIIQASSYTAHITGADGTLRDIEWEPTNYYAQEKAAPPANTTLIGGKTGTTTAAGNCLILLVKDPDTLDPYISVVMGAESKDLLYQDMTTMIQARPDTSDSSNPAETE